MVTVGAEHPGGSLQAHDIVDEIASTQGFLEVVVVSPARPIFTGSAKHLSIMAANGSLGIWPRHTDLVAALGVGVTFAAWYWFAFLRITFDRDTGQVEHRSLRPFGSRSKFIDLAKVNGARIEAQWSDGVRLTRLALDTEDGVAALEYGYSSTDRAVESAINEWLTRPG